MYTLFLILLNFQSLAGTLFRKKSKCNSINNNDLFSNETRLKIKKFKMHEEEIKEFYDSLDRIINLNNKIIEHIMNLQHANNSNDFGKYSLPSLAEFINYVVELRKNAETKQVCEYEFLKSCELYYQSLFHIIKFEENLQFHFFEFSMKNILPSLNSISEALNEFKSIGNHNVLIRKVYIQKISNQENQLSLLNFLIKFLEDQGTTISLDQIDRNYTINNLLALCINVFCRFYLCNRSKSRKFYLKFLNQDYSISKEFRHCLFTNGFLAGLFFDIRLQLRCFFRIHNLDLERQFIEQRKIPPVSDLINKYSSILNLSQIG